MFTGIIEDVGTIHRIQKQTDGMKLTIQANTILENIHLGDSIAVNGVCLTVTSFTTSQFCVDVMDETIKRSSFTHLTNGSKVNLERAMSMQQRFGGHIVSGHIDGIGKITQIKKVGIAIIYTIQTSSRLTKYMIEKGSVAIDGISLTIISISPTQFQVSIIPHTITNTTMYLKKLQDNVNIEVDCIGKYIEKLLSISDDTITKEFLIKHGF